MSSSKPVVAVLISRKMQAQMLTAAARAEFVERFEVRWPDAEEKVAPEQAAELLRGAEGCYGGWGMPALDEKTLAHADGLRILAYSAGSVKGLVGDEVWKRGIVVTSAAADNAVDVAHYTLGVMLLSAKNYIELSGSCAKGNWWRRDGYRPPDDFRGSTVGIIAASYIGRLVLKLLDPFGVERLLYDPYVTSEQIGRAHV